MLLLRKVARLSGVEFRRWKAIPLLFVLVLLPLRAHAALSGWAYGWNISSSNACPDQGEGFNCDNSAPPYYHIGTVEGGIAGGTTTIAAGSFVEVLTLFDFHGDTKLINGGTLITPDFQVGLGEYWNYRGYAKLEMTNTGSFELTRYSSIGGGGGDGTFNVTGGTIKAVIFVLGDFDDLVHPYTGALIERGIGNVSATSVTSFNVTNDLQVANGDFKLSNSTLEVDGALSIARWGGAGSASFSDLSKVNANSLVAGEGGGTATVSIDSSKAAFSDSVILGTGTDSVGTMTVKGKNEDDSPVLKVDKHVMLGYQGGDATFVATDTSISFGNDLTIGDQGTGQLSVTGSVLSVGGFANIGWNKDGDGSASFKGDTEKKTEVTIDRNLTIGGNGGKGLVTIEQATIAVTENLIVGYLNDSNGTLTVIGNPDDETFPVSPHVTIGSHLLLGEGKAASVTLDAKDMAHIAVSKDVALRDKTLVNLKDSLLTIDGSLRIADAKLDVGAMILDGASRISRPSPTGQAGTPGSFSPVEFVAIGHQGNGSLDVKSDSQVFAKILSIGHEKDSFGTLSIAGRQGNTDPTSIVRVTEDALVGYRGTGTLNVEAGGKFVVGKYLAIAFEGNNSALNVRNGGVVELLHYPDEVLFDRVSVGRMKPEGGSLLVDESSVLKIQGSGNLVNVFRGKADLLGETKIELYGRLVGIDSKIAESIERTDSTLRFSRSLTVDTKNATIERVGESVAVGTAGSISIGELPGYAKTWNARSGSVQLGNLNVDTRATAGSVPGGRLVPELLRVGCTASFFDSQSCGVDTLSLRVFAEASESTSGGGAVGSIANSFDAWEFVKAPRTFSAAVLSDQIYSLGQAGPLDIGFLELDGLRVAARQTQSGGGGGGEITIFIRGTDPSLTVNWAANAGFLNASDTMQAYLGNLSAFTAGVVALNPGAQIRFVGHSLGGGLAMMLGAVSGYDAFAFNAPHIGTLYDQDEAYGDDVNAIVGLRNTDTGPNGNKSFDRLVNVTYINDPVSGIPVLRRMGQELTIVGDPFEYYARYPGQLSEQISPLARAAITTILSQFTDFVTFGLEAHSIKTLLDKMTETRMEIVRVCNESGCTEYQPDIEPMLERIFFPNTTTGSDLGRFVDRFVEKSVLYFLDPDAYVGFLFDSEAGSPSFQSVLAPDVGMEGLQYDVQVLAGETWIEVGSASPNERVALPDGTRQFRLIPSSSIITDDDLFFGVSFASSGQFTGSISAVPEPDTYATMLCGLLLLFSYAALRGYRGMGQRSQGR